MKDISIETWIAVLMLASLSLVATIIGVGVALRLGNDRRAIATGIGFSVGIMILISVVELLPESIRTGSVAQAAVAALLGMGLVATAHLLIPHTHLVEEYGRTGARRVSAAYLVAFGLVLHDVPEGIAMANSYMVTPALGVLTAITIAVHNIPEEFAMAAPLVAVRQRRVLFGAALASALAEPLGAIIGLVAVTARPSLNSWFLGFAAGAMLYVSVHELVPMAREHGHPRRFALGAALSVPAFLALGAVVDLLS